jgi:hypothetical protein
MVRALHGRRKEWTGAVASVRQDDVDRDREVAGEDLHSQKNVRAHCKQKRGESERNLAATDRRLHGRHLRGVAGKNERPVRRTQACGVSPSVEHCRESSGG